MKNFTYFILAGLFTLLFHETIAQQLSNKNLPQKTRTTPGKVGAPLKAPRRCTTMEELEKAIQADPTLPEKWKATGDSMYQQYLNRVRSGQRLTGTQDNPIIIPIVFHLVDNDTHLSWISDRDIYEQVEILNQDFNGEKATQYAGVIPSAAYSRVGSANIKFVLARRDPSGNLTTGIERRTNPTPDHVSIKANATGGLDAWDVNKYLNIWCGTFSGGDAGLLGISTFPFTTGQGPHGVVIGLITLPYADLNVPRASSTTEGTYYPNYAEGSTLSHEIGHYFYLFHTFGDQASCNNNDFGIQSGWPLGTGTGADGDDTPMQKGTGSSPFIYGNPSMDYNVGCETTSFGILYGTYMNYFDDRALFMFSKGETRRVDSCLVRYRSGLISSDGASAPVAVTDAYLVNVSSRGYIDKRTFLVNNTPFSATVRNSGTSALTTVTLNVGVDAGAPVSTVFPLTLAPGRDTTLNLAAITGAAGNHTLTVYTTSPNGTTDNFLGNDTLKSLVNIQAGTATLPFSENFTSATFPPANWLLWNANGGATNTWTRSSTSGSGAAGAAFFDNFNINQLGTLDDLITPAIDLASSPGALLNFKVAHGAFDLTDVSTWDGLEVYVSGDGGKTYNLAYKKTGINLATVATAQTGTFTATPAEPAKWRSEAINLTPFIVAGQKMILKFRNTNAFGNNLYLDDISVTATTGVGTNDAQISAIVSPANGATISCPSVNPVVTIRNVGTNALTAATINVMLNGTFAFSQAWTGSLTTGSSANVNLTTALNVPAVGSNTIKIYTTLPNGLADATPSNDTAIAVITKLAPSAIPVTNGFETTLLPAGWSLNNPSSPTLLWFRFNPTVAAGGTFAAAIDNYGVDGAGTFDDIVTPSINTTSLLANDSLQISFDLAYKNYPDPAFYDSLKILVSTNCGATWTTIWERGGQGLATAGESDQQYIPASLADWKTQKVSIGNNLFGGGQVQVAFRNVGFFGNVLWLDNINIDIKPRKDMATTAIVRPNLTECAPPIIPSITVRNLGGETVTGFKTGYILNNGTPFIQVHNIPLAPGASTTVTFPSLNPPVGNNTIKMFVADPLTATPGTDGTPSNDTLVRTFFVATATVPNVVEGFENATFPPANWFRINPDNSLTWQRTSPGKNSNFSAYVDNYDYATGAYLFDYLQPPPINTTGADSLIITFDVANQYWTDGVDTSVDNLSVLIARNCATTFSTVYSKTGTDLATAGGGPDGYVSPAASDWRKERISVNLVTTPANNVVVQFRNGDAYGNNTYIDNINIIPLFKRDIEVVSISPDVVCTPGITPVATIRNRGLEPITGYSITYSIGTGAAATPVVVTGVNIAPGATVNVTLPAGTLAAGANNVKVYTFAPVTASGTGDQYVANDTLIRVSFATTTPVSAPLVEAFEGTFLPTGWALSNPDNSITWQKSTAGKSSAGSAFMRNFIYLGANGTKDLLYTPVVNFTGVDSVQLSFDLSAATKASPAAVGPKDTLEVLVTKDCGNTFTSVYKKWGVDLQTVLDPVSPLPSEYTPFADYLWRTENIDLSSFRPNGPLQIVFKNSSNTGNNIFIDNVNFRTRTLPPRLKTDGFIIQPVPFADQFNIWYVQAPADLRYVTVYNSAGQRIWSQTFGNGSSSNVITVNLFGKAAGIYTVYLGYSDKSKDKQVRILKANE